MPGFEIETSAWLVANVLSKLLVYVGVAAAIGGLSSRLLVMHKGSITGAGFSGIQFVALTLGLLGAAGHFFVQVGIFSESGLTGLADLFVIKMLWESDVGTQALCRGAGLFLALLLYLALCSRSGAMKAIRNRAVAMILTVILSGWLAYSFTLTGHSANLGLLGSIAVSLHVLAVFWWVGSLYPLWKICKEHSSSGVFEIMDYFGKLAVAFVATLVIAGSVLSFAMLESPAQLVHTSYGRALFLKIAFVSLLLLFAARHKWQLTPALSEGNPPEKLRRSIAWEGIVALIILLITAFLSTSLGPPVFSH